MTEQEQFDTAVKGVIAQGGPAIANSTCLYRAPDGKKCAFGHLIPDSEYNAEMEGLGAVNSVFDSFFREQHPDYNRNLVMKLQDAHDGATYFDKDSFINEFKKRARNVAHSFNLDASCLAA